MFKKSAAVERRRKITRKAVDCGKPKGGHEGIRDPLSLALLSLLTAPLCVGSSKLLQLLLNELFTFKRLHSTLCNTPNHARHILNFILKKYLSNRLQHRLQTTLQIFGTQSTSPAQKVNYVYGALPVSQRKPGIGMITGSSFAQ